MNGPETRTGRDRRGGGCMDLDVDVDGTSRGVVAAKAGRRSALVGRQR